MCSNSMIVKLLENICSLSLSLRERQYWKGVVRRKHNSTRQKIISAKTSQNLYYLKLYYKSEANRLLSIEYTLQIWSKKATF